MAENTEKPENLLVEEAQDGSATIELSEDLQKLAGEDSEAVDSEGKSDDQRANSDAEATEDAPGDDEELRAAKRNRRKAKKELIRKTNQEKDLRLSALVRENEQLKRTQEAYNQRLAQLERNTKAETIVRIEKGMEEAQVRLEYAKMKMAEAARNSDGDAVVEAQTLWHQAQEEVRRLADLKTQADEELKRPPQQSRPLPDPTVQRNAAEWMRRNSWYDPRATDKDSLIAKKHDEAMAAEGWNPSDPDYWEELDSRLQKALPHRYSDSSDEESVPRKPRNVVGSAGREASAAYGGSNRSQFVLSPERVRAMKEAGAWDNPERKKRMIENYLKHDRMYGRNN